MPDRDGSHPVHAEVSLVPPPLDELQRRVPSKFALAVLAARRARDINDYYGQLGSGVGKIPPPQVSSVAHKSVSLAFEEIAAGRIGVAPAKTDDETETEDEVPPA